MVLLKMVFKIIYNFTNEIYKNYKMTKMILTKIEVKFIIIYIFYIIKMFL